MLVYVTYFAIALSILAALSVMILKITDRMGHCPQTGSAARSAGLTIATGFVAIGLGGVMLAAALIPALLNQGPLALLIALGIASLALGLGFTQAMATLRGVVAEAAEPKAPESEPRMVQRAAKEGR